MQSQIADWVEKGLKWWRRPLLRGKNQRLFLTTIACEGGLPLRLLQRENAHLTQFFRILLETYYRAGQGGASVTERIARQQAHRLPRSLQQEPVFHLAAALIAKIGELQASIGETSVDPITALDEKAPNWRRDLPLRLDDQVAETLLTGLVRRSGELVREATERLRWRGRLQEIRTGWQVEKHLELPDRSAGQVRISEDSLARLGAGWETRVRLEMIWLWAPKEPPVVLHAIPDQLAIWKIPADLEPGPWWIVGRDGDWTRFRPLLWGIATDGATAPNLIHVIVRFKEDAHLIVITVYALETP